jgi:hypothetical protein
VSRRSAVEKSRLERTRALPWLALLRGTMVIGKRWRALSERDRARIARLVRESRGWPGNLNARQRAELRLLLAKLDPMRIARELVALTGGRKRRGRRRRAHV